TRSEDQKPHQVAANQPKGVKPSRFRGVRGSSPGERAGAPAGGWQRRAPTPKARTVSAALVLLSLAPLPGRKLWQSWEPDNWLVTAMMPGLMAEAPVKSSVVD